MTQRLCRHCILGGQLHSLQHRERNIDDLLRSDDMLSYYDNNDDLEGSGIKKGLFTKNLNDYNLLSSFTHHGKELWFIFQFIDTFIENIINHIDQEIGFGHGHRVSHSSLLYIISFLNYLK